jgi:hypothetical protein
MVMKKLPPIMSLLKKPVVCQSERSEESACAAASLRLRVQLLTAPSGALPDGMYLLLSFQRKLESRTSRGVRPRAPRNDFTLLAPRTRRWSTREDIADQIHRIRDINRAITVGVTSLKRRRSWTP